MRFLIFLLFFSSFLFGSDYIKPTFNDPLKPSLINGVPAKPGEFPEVVNIRSGNSLCTATIIGPRVIITAAHCVETGEISSFLLDGQTYYAVITRSPIYPAVDHDIALGVLNAPVKTKFATIGGIPEIDDRVTLTGYGCTQPGGSGGNDGILRVGDSIVIGFEGFDFLARKPGGAALCFGDSGGPVFEFMINAFSEDHILMGINSKGNIRDLSLLTRTDLKDTRDFLKTYANVNDVKICGINLGCLNKKPPRPPGCWVNFANAIQKAFNDLTGCL